MKTYRITIEVDEKWFNAIENFTNDIYEGEVFRWISVEELGEV